jgi:hypothetical protein
MVHGKTAVVPDTAVAFNIGTSKLGTNPSAETIKKCIKYQLTYYIKIQFEVILHKNQQVPACAEIVHEGAPKVILHK